MADMNQSLQVTYELVQTKVQDKAAAQTEKSMKKLASKATLANASIAAATGAAVGAIAALGGAMFLTVGAASKFEDSFAGIRKTVDASEGDFNRLGAQIRQLAQDIPVAVTQLNAIGELGGQLGVDVENLEEFIEITLTILTSQILTKLTIGELKVDKFKDFDEALEADNILKLQMKVAGKTYDLPAVLPAKAVLSQMKMAEEGNQSLSSIAEWVESIVGKDNFNSMLDDGIGWEKLNDILVWLLEAYGLATPDEVEEAVAEAETEEGDSPK